MGMTEKEYLFMISHTVGLGAVTIYKMKEYFGDFRTIWKAGEKELLDSKLLSPKRVQAMLECKNNENMLKYQYHDLDKNKIRYITYFEEEYPERLRPYKDRPAGIFVKGKLPDDLVPTAAIVGARNCTEYGKQVAEYLAFELSKKGVQIISGLALGVDSAAHRGSLKAEGNTFAVLGCGVNVCYPRENATG